MRSSSVRAVALAAACMIMANCAAIRAIKIRTPESLPPNYVFRPGPLCSKDGNDLQVRASQLGGFVDKDALLAFVKKQMTGVVFIAVENDPKQTAQKGAGGTGFAVGKRKMPSGEIARGVLTNHHVIKHALQISMMTVEISGDGRSFKTGKKIPMVVAAASQSHDVAYLVPVKGTLSLRSFLPKLTRPVFLTEVLWHFGMTTFCDFGMVSHVGSKNPYSPTPAHVLLLTNGDYGDSGSPVVDADGFAVGIVVGYLWPHAAFLPIYDALRVLDIITK